MPTRSEAEENLRVIRSLMEKATIYRAVSAPSALVGGLLALFVSAALILLPSSAPDHKPAWLYFTVPWLLVLAAAAAANIVFLWKESQRRGDPFVSSGMRLACRALFPNFLVAGIFTILLTRGDELSPPLATIWMLTYGLALLATRDFAPNSITLLGWAFLLSGLSLAIALFSAYGMGFFTDPIRSAHLIMGGTFGLFHLIYAACTWPRKKAASDSAGEG